MTRWRAVVLAMALALAACGSGDGDAALDVGDSTTTATTARPGSITASGAATSTTQAPTPSTTSNTWSPPASAATTTTTPDATTTTAAAATTSDPVMLPGTDWRFVSLVADGDPVDLDARAASFSFDSGGGVYRMAGCNAFGGELAIEPGVLHLGSAVGTTQGCAPDAQALDDALLRFSDGDVAWSIEATGRLHLDARDVAGELERLSPADTDGRDQLDEIVLEGENWYLGFDRVNNVDSVVFAVREGPGGPWGGGAFVVPGEPFDGWVDPLPDRPERLLWSVLPAGAVRATFDGIEVDTYPAPHDLRLAADFVDVDQGTLVAYDATGAELGQRTMGYEP